MLNSGGEKLKKFWSMQREARTWKECTIGRLKVSRFISVGNRNGF